VLKTILEDLKSDEVIKRIDNHKNMVFTINELREKNIPFCNQLIDDLNKPIVYNSNLRFVYIGIICILTLLLNKDD
jgi:hypothetical protein